MPCARMCALFSQEVLQVVAVKGLIFLHSNPCVRSTQKDKNKY